MKNEKTKTGNIIPEVEPQSLFQETTSLNGASKVNKISTFSSEVLENKS